MYCYLPGKLFAPFVTIRYLSSKTPEHAMFKDKQLPKCSAELDLGGVQGPPKIFPNSHPRSDSLTLLDTAMGTQRPISDCSAARLLIYCSTITLLLFSFSLGRHTWSEIFWWEDNTALSFILTNHFIYNMCTWQVISEDVQLKYDAMESGSNWWGSLDCKSTTERQNIVKISLKYKSGTSVSAEREEKE